MMPSVMKSRLRSVHWLVLAAVACYAMLAYRSLTDQSAWGFDHHSAFRYLLTPLSALYAIGLLGGDPRIRSWAVWTPVVALYGFLAYFAQALRSSSFPGAHVSSGDSYLYTAAEFLLVFLYTLPATLLLVLPSARRAFVPRPSDASSGDQADLVVPTRHRMPWPYLLSAACYGAVIYYAIVAAFGFPGDYLFRYLLPVLAAGMILGLLLRYRIARGLAVVFPLVALAGVIMFFAIADSINAGAMQYHYPPGATWSYFACALIPVFVFTVPAAVLLLWPVVVQVMVRRAWRGNLLPSES